MIQQNDRETHLLEINDHLTEIWEEYMKGVRGWILWDYTCMRWHGYLVKLKLSHIFDIFTEIKTIDQYVDSTLAIM